MIHEDLQKGLSSFDLKVNVRHLGHSNADTLPLCSPNTAAMLLTQGLFSEVSAWLSLLQICGSLSPVWGALPGLSFLILGEASNYNTQT